MESDPGVDRAGAAEALNDMSTAWSVEAGFPTSTSVSDSSMLDESESSLSLSSQVEGMESRRKPRDPATLSKSGLNGCSWTDPTASNGQPPVSRDKSP